MKLLLMQGDSFHILVNCVTIQEKHAGVESWNFSGPGVEYS